MFYAKQSPRGFANEINVYAFATKAARDEWVDRHANDGDVNSAACGAETCTAKEAKKIVGYRGDAITKSYNSDIMDGDDALATEKRGW
jgi:hypothetical protein